MEATAIMNPYTNRLVVSKKTIKEVTLRYCKETLKNNEPSEGYEDIMRTKKECLDKKILECNGSFKPTKEAFDLLIHKFRKSRKQNYNFLIKASKGFQDIVFRFAQTMIEEEQFPVCFKETTLHMIFKGGKGKRHNLSANRFIHSKFWFPRLVEGLVVLEGLKKTISKWFLHVPNWRAARPQGRGARICHEIHNSKIQK